jgi:hypothetical protein
MPDQQTNTGGTPAAPAINPAPPPPEMSGASSYVARRVGPMAEKMQQQLAGERQSEPDAQPSPQPQQTPPAEQKIKVGDGEFTAAELQSAIAAKAEADVRRSSLPKDDAGYEVRNSADFRLPEGVTNFEFDMADPTLAAARKFAVTNGLSQEVFSGMLDLFVASKSGELLNQARAREANMAQLGAAGPQRIGAIATWLRSIAGKDGAAVADFITQFPSAPVVRSLETVIKRYSSQGGADYSGQHRESADAEAGKIPGYENMSFAQVRARQMVERMRDPNYARGVRPGGRRGE